MELYPHNATLEVLQAATDEELRKATASAAEIVEINTPRRNTYASILATVGHLLNADDRREMENLRADTDETVTRWQGLGLKCENEQRSRAEAARQNAAANWHTLNEAAGLAQRRGEAETATKLRLMASEIAEQNDVDPFRDE